MGNVLLIVLGIVLVVNVVIPVIVVWLVIKYIFRLRQHQNEIFLEDLYDVVRTATYDALIAKENSQKNKRS